MNCSIVLLLRRPRFFSKKELEEAGEKGFHRPFGEEGSMYFVVHDPPVTLIKAGTNVINVLHASEPYLNDVGYVAAQLPQEEQRKAWLQHSAWAALDLWNPDSGKKEAYDALARFALQLGDDDCCGVYLPKEQMMMPNDGTAEQGLRMMIEQELPFGRS
ncbi:MAG: hypothetical protein M3O02_10770 [Acidobacteriota bacterium]|nr:hypothetical protein [Acidobacteriota bacterium]